jgi:hypothetical protein
MSLATLAAPADAFEAYSVGGSTLGSSIQPTIDLFRAAIGGANNGDAAAPLVGGRREIDWDGGGAATSVITDSTFIGFQDSRGATLATPGTDFLQTPLDDAYLAGIQPSYQTTFSVYSAQRVFTPLRSNITNVTFTAPGSNGATPATVTAFGAVFSDVDLANTTSLEFFDPRNASLARIFVPTYEAGAAPQGLSFVGVNFMGGEKIARVQITTGNQPLGLADSNGEPVDVVVMDDFLYAEPVALVAPEPGSAVLTAIALLVAAALLRAKEPNSGLS